MRPTYLLWGSLILPIFAVQALVAWQREAFLELDTAPRLGGLVSKC